MPRRVLIASIVGVVALACLTPQAAAPIPVTILDGESGGPYHDWKHVTPVLQKMLDETGLFAVTVVTASSGLLISWAAPETN